MNMMQILICVNLVNIYKQRQLVIFERNKSAGIPRFTVYSQTSILVTRWLMLYPLFYSILFGLMDYVNTAALQLSSCS